MALILFFGPFQRDSLGNIPASSRAYENKADVRKPRIVIGNIILEEPHIVFHLGKGKEKPENPILEQLPSVLRGAVINGSIELVLKDSQQMLIVREGNIAIYDFSSGGGGRVGFSGGFHYTLPDRGKLDVQGSCSGSLDFAALTPRPAGSGNLTVNIDRGSYGPASFNQLAAKVFFSVRGDEIALKNAEFALGGMQYITSKQAVNIKDVRLQGGAVYNLDTGVVRAGPLKGNLLPAGEFSGSLAANMKGTKTFKASIDTTSLDLAKIYESIRGYLPAGYRNWSAQGKGSAQTGIEGTYSQSTLTIRGRHHVIVTGGGLSVQDGSKAAQGVQSQADLTFAYDTTPEKFDFELRSTLSGGEFLWGGYYRDFSGKTARADAGGTFRFNGEMPFAFNAETDLFGAGAIKFSGSGKRGGQTFSVDAKELSLQKIVAIFLDDYLKQNFPSLAGRQINGSSSLSLNVKRIGEQNNMNGSIIVVIPALTIPDQKIDLTGMSLNLPFDLGYPKPAAVGKPQQGLLEIKSASKDRIRTENVRIPLLLSGNKLRLPEDAVIHIASGDVMITNFAADNILSPDVKISCGLRIDNVNLRPIERSFTLSPITGTISADYPNIEYYREALTAGGSTKVELFGGEIEMGIVSIERLSAASRKINTDISFKNINLEQVTEKIAIGKMTGVIQGSLKDFEMEYGQPTRFVLDIDSADTSGVSQRISVEAIQSISILGTGSGMSGVLNRGIMSFFKDYPYSSIGIQAKLGNDVFTIRGKVHSGGTEYLVKRGFLRGVDVVNQNPDNKISFKDMQERLTRIFESRKAGGAPVVQ